MVEKKIIMEEIKAKSILDVRKSNCKDPKIGNSFNFHRKMKEVNATGWVKLDMRGR